MHVRTVSIERCAACLIDDAWDLLLRRGDSRPGQQRLTPRSAEQHDERRDDAALQAALDLLRTRGSFVRHHGGRLGGGAGQGRTCDVASSRSRTIIARAAPAGTGPKSVSSAR